MVVILLALRRLAEGSEAKDLRAALTTEQVVRLASLSVGQTTRPALRDSCLPHPATRNRFAGSPRSGLGRARF